MLGNVITTIKDITSRISENEYVPEPNMWVFIDTLILISMLDGKERRKCFEAYAEMFSVQFGNPKCVDRTDSAMWRLFRAVYNEVRKNGYKIDKNSDEAFIIKKLVSIGAFCLQEKEVGRKYFNSSEFNLISDYKERYMNSDEVNQKLKEFVYEAYEEIYNYYFEIK